MTGRPDRRTADAAADSDDGAIYVDRGDRSRIASVILAVAMLSLVAILAFFLLQASHDDEVQAPAPGASMPAASG